MGVFGGDYIGFSYNGVHSSELGIMRVSDGSRYNENLLPTSKDITVQVPGGDGTYYFGSYYTQRSFTISYAFDGLRENQVEFIKEFFGDKKIHPLIFDEHPYKIYYAKVASTTSIKYIPFSENNQRIFKGEGSL
jgi:predicted phage tail component-like protein